MLSKRVEKFLFPELNRTFVIRLSLVALGAYLFFGHICIPTRARGRSMEPTYLSGGVNFCWRPRYWFSRPARGDVVVVRLSGMRVMFLKRIVALAGDTVEFRNGELLVNGEEQDEPYVNYPCEWNLAPRTVKPGHVYVVGDNRGMRMAKHRFGQTAERRIVGGLLW